MKPWRVIRNSSPKECRALDFLTNQGEFASKPLKNPFLLVGGAGYGGKQLDLETPIPTPCGWKTMGTLCLGDVVFAEDGAQTVVVALSKIDYSPNAVEVEFTSGEIIKCDRNHLWKTLTVNERAQLLRRTEDFRSKRRAIRPSRAEHPEKLTAQLTAARNAARNYTYLHPPRGTVRTTKEIESTIVNHRGELNHAILNACPLQMPERDLPIEPYLLGLWLGDGWSHVGKIGMLDSDLEQVLRHVALPVAAMKSGGPKHRRPYSTVRFEGLSKLLRLAGVIRCKRIPAAYLRASAGQRLALLQGIMDTDGYADQDGKCGIGLSDERLIGDVHELVSSLGIKATVTSSRATCNGKDCGLTYRLLFQSVLPLFRLTRKLTLQKCGARRSHQRTICAIRPCLPVPMRCIEVDHPRRTYLVGRSMIVTHNSYGIRTAAVEILLEFRRLGFPNQELAIFCSTMPNLKDRQIGKIRKEFRGFADVVGSQIDGPHVRFYGQGTEGLGVIKLRSVAEATAASGKKGAEFSAILVDELTEFTRDQFGEILYMKRSGENLPFCPFMGATNPDGIGHDWVKKLWIPEYQDFSDEDPAIQKMKHCFFFIPMLKSDNRTYEQNKDTVDMAINAIEDPEIRRARDQGSWDIYTGGRFTTYSKKVHSFEHQDFLDFYGYESGPTYYDQRAEFERIVKNAPNFGLEVWGGLDYGTSVDGASSFHLHVVDWERNIWTFLEMYMSGMSLVPQAKKLGPVIREYNPRAIYCDPSLQAKMAESEDAKSRIQMFKDADPDVRMRPGNNDRIGGWATFDVLLHYEKLVDDTGRSVILSPPKWRIHSGCVNLHRQLGKAPRDKSRREDVSGNFKDDHALDDARYFCHTRFQGSVRRTKKPERGSLAWLIQQRKTSKVDQWD